MLGQQSGASKLGWDAKSLRMHIVGSKDRAASGSKGIGSASATGHVLAVLLQDIITGEWRRQGKKWGEWDLQNMNPVQSTLFKKKWQESSLYTLKASSLQCAWLRSFELPQKALQVQLRMTDIAMAENLPIESNVVNKLWPWVTGTKKIGGEKSKSLKPQNICHHLTHSRTVLNWECAKELQ